MDDALRRARRGLALTLLAGVLVLGAAHVFQHGFGYEPCPLCLRQRQPWWAVIALSGVALLAVFFLHRSHGRAAARLARWTLVLCGVILLGGAGLAAYHSGVEWGWWPGPDTCSGAAGVGAASTLEALREALMAAPVVRCDAVVWSLFGLSMAGYNALLSLGVAGAALWHAALFRGRGA